MDLKPSALEVLFSEELINVDNPFKKTVRQIRLRCAICDDHRVILGKGIGSEKDWDIVRRHMRIWHGIELGGDIPVRLLSSVLFKKWIRLKRKEK